MISQENQNAIQEMKDIYSDISEWLKFAEAKHAGFFAAGIAIIAIILDKCQGVNMKSCLAIIIPVLIMLPSLISQIPFLNGHPTLVKRTVKYYSNKNIMQNNGQNNVFYLSIFIRSQTHSNTFKATYLNQMGATDHSDILLNSYLDQIVEISKVASIKYYLFHVAIRNLGLVLAIILVCFVIA